MNLLEQLMNMLGSLRTANMGSISNNGHNHVHDHESHDFSVNAAQMTRYSTDMEEGTMHLPADEEGCDVCYSTKNVFGDLVEHIH